MCANIINEMSTTGARALVLLFGCFSLCVGITSLLFFQLKRSADGIPLPSSLSLTEFQNAQENLQLLFATHFKLATLCFSCVYLIKQTFAIPGSALLNITAGWLLPFYIAFPLISLLTAIGATCCFMFSAKIASEAIVNRFADRFAPGKLHQIRKQVYEATKRQELLYYLLCLRVFPFSPNWLLNITCPWLKVPKHLFFLSVFFGLMPYNFITLQAGSMFATLSSTKDIFDQNVIAALVLLSLALLLPIWLKKKFQRN